jgi:hypothetical protein
MACCFFMTQNQPDLYKYQIIVIQNLDILPGRQKALLVIMLFHYKKMKIMNRAFELTNEEKNYCFLLQEIQ